MAEENDKNFIYDWTENNGKCYITHNINSIQDILKTDDDFVNKCTDLWGNHHPYISLPIVDNKQMLLYSENNALALSFGVDKIQTTEIINNLSVTNIEDPNYYKYYYTFNNKYYINIIDINTLEYFIDMAKNLYYEEYNQNPEEIYFSITCDLSIPISVIT